jgi:excinuclease ABC subunit A
VIKTADWVLDLGPEGGDKGGEIVAEGTPEQVAKEPRSYTGHYLAPLLSNPAHVERSRDTSEAATASAVLKPKRKQRVREAAE